jgi:hypothetical protein
VFSFYDDSREVIVENCLVRLAVMSETYWSIRDVRRQVKGIYYLPSAEEKLMSSRPESSNSNPRLSFTALA